jgi:CubicO group peptidase (beta-lactamase class C family)
LKFRAGNFPGNRSKLCCNTCSTVRMRYKARPFAVVATMAAFAQPLKAQSGDSLRAAMARALTEERFVGATWALVYPESTVVGAAGLKDVTRGTPMSPHDRVQVASVAKTLIATGILQLATRRQVDIDAPVSTYLADVSFLNPWDSAAPLRVRHLLDHTGGLDDARMWQVFSTRSRPDSPLSAGLPRNGKGIRIRHPPGDRFSYSNTGFLLLGMIIEAVTRERYESWLDRELLLPIGMTRSTFRFVTQTGHGADTTLAMGHFDSRTTSSAAPIHVRPASQFTTTAADMARFARFLMSDGSIDGKPLLDSVYLRGMGKPVTTEAVRAGLLTGYAFGLMRRDRHGAVGLCHFGNVGTFRAALCLYPAEGKAFFISHNVDPEDGNFDRLDKMLIDALGVSSDRVQPPRQPGVDPREWEGLYVVRPSRFEQFAYIDELTGATRVKWDGRTLRLIPLQGQDRVLTPVGEAFFRGDARNEATHVLTVSPTGGRIVTDGMRTFEQVDPARLYAYWASAAAGILSMLYVLIVGGLRSVRALRARRWRSEPLKWPTLCIAALVIAPVLYLTQSFLAIGDPTVANVTMALLTGLLPLALLLAAKHRLRTAAASRAAWVDLLAVGGALQWWAVLAFWGLVPLMLWR